MKRRHFLSTIGSTFIFASTVIQEANSAIGLEFELTGIPKKKPSKVESITIQFTKLQLTPSHIDDSQSAKITVTVDLEPYGSEQIEDTVKLQNGESTSLRSSEINPIILDELTIPTNVSAVQGTLKIKIDHSDITETYNQKFSVTGAEFVQAEGGTTVTDETINGQKYRIHAFESTGKDEFKVKKAPFNDSMDILLVAGGGGGGENDGGGGGAGGLIYISGQSLTTGTYQLNIGSGGDGATKGSTGFGMSGEDTTGFGLTAIGGGGAAPQQKTAKDGGSGGGAGHANSTGGKALQPDSSDGGFGSNGGQGEIGNQEPYPGGGGGGALEQGKSPDSTNERGDGGDGKDYSNKFTEQFGEDGSFAGGGGGGTQNKPRSEGGNGGGGDGGYANNSSDIDPQDGQTNTGGGGGGTGEGGYQDAGDGGSGIILIRYPIE